MMIVDAHVHTYPSAEVGRQAMQGAGTADLNGTVDELLSIMRDSGIDSAVMVNMTPAKDMEDAALAKLPADMKPDDRKAAETEIVSKMISRLQRRNIWTCEVGKEHPQLYPSVSVDAMMDSQAMVAEVVDKIENHGAKVLKLHPSNGRFFPNDRSLWPVYEKAGEMGLPIISHAGRFIAGGDTQYAEPRHFEDAISDFPAVSFVLAHLGHGYTDQSLQLAEKYPNVYFDTSAFLSGLPQAGLAGDEALSEIEAAELIRKLGVDRILFGSDFPWFHPATSLRFIEKLPLADEEIGKVLSENATRILKL